MGIDFKDLNNSVQLHSPIMRKTCIFIANKNLIVFCVAQLLILIFCVQCYSLNLKEDPCPITDRKWAGGYFREILTDNWEDCGERCCDNGNCAGWTWKPTNETGQCYMYDTARSVVSEDGVYSGDKCCIHPP